VVVALGRHSGLKRDLLEGRYGRPLRLATLCAWPRDRAYYRRNSWAGRLRDRDSGAWVLDSPANNAMAHFLHNALFVLGPAMAHSALPAAVTAELARAYPIDSADTAACRVMTDGGCEVLFLASHVTERPIEPRFASNAGRGHRTARPTAASWGRRRPVTEYDDPDATHQFHKLFVAIDRPGPGVSPRAAWRRLRPRLCAWSRRTRQRSGSCLPALLARFRTASASR
jgi:hypothetical protein